MTAGIRFHQVMAIDLIDLILNILVSFTVFLAFDNQLNIGIKHYSTVKEDETIEKQIREFILATTFVPALLSDSYHFKTYILLCFKVKNIVLTFILFYHDCQPYSNDHVSVFVIT